MFRPTTGFMVVGLVIFGIIVADFLIHPQGTKAVANGAVALATPAERALLGKTP